MPGNTTMRAVRIEFPMGGTSRQFSYQSQPPYTTSLSLNVWPIDSPTGRFRGGVRPGLSGSSDTMGGLGGAIYGWCRLSYYDSGIKIGIAIVGSDGSYETLNGTTYTNRIADDPSLGSAPGFASVACYNGTLFQAASNEQYLQYRILPSGTSSTINLHPDVVIVAAGSVPTYCGGVLAHGDRLWLYGDRLNPHVVYASAVGQYYNWDYSDPTAGGAFVNTGSEGGVLGEPVLAGISHSNNVVLFGGPTSIYAYRGNPKTGSVQRISPHIGPITNNAWCKAGDGNTYFLGPTGPAYIPAGDGGTPVMIGDGIPNEMIGLSPYAGDKVSVGYDQRWRMVHYFVVPNSGSAVSWAYKLPTSDAPGSWWKQDLESTISVAATMQEAISANKSSLIMFTSTGLAYQFDRTSTNDFNSYLLLGPIRLGDAFTDGVLHSVQASVADDSDTFDWEVFAGESAEAAFYNVDPNGDGNIADRIPAFEGARWDRIGLNYMQHPRVRANCCYLLLFDVEDNKWLLESIEARIQGGYKRLVQTEGINPIIP